MSDLTLLPLLPRMSDLTLLPLNELRDRFLTTEQ